MNTCGLGHDVVDVAAFAEQLAEPGSRMRALFSVREVRQASDRARQKNDGEAVHLAAKWAGKEGHSSKRGAIMLAMPAIAFTLDNFPWPEIEILDDAGGVPHVSLGKGAASVFPKLITRIRLPALAIPLLIPLLPMTGLMQWCRSGGMRVRRSARLSVRGRCRASPYFPEPRWFDCLRGGDDFCGIAPEAPECYMLYNVSIMVNLWGALTSRGTCACSRTRSTSSTRCPKTAGS